MSTLSLFKEYALSVIQWKRMGSFSTVVAEGERPSDLGGLTPTIEADLALSFLYVSKMLFHPVLHCIMTSLVTLKPRSNEKNCLDFYS